jgi:IS30 family transposase
MASKLSADERERIADELRAGKSVREVVQSSGRSLGAISKVAASLELERDRERSQTKRATEVHIASARAKLAQLAPRLADVALRLLQELWNERSAHGKAQIMIATGIAVQRAREIVGPESDTVDLSELEAWLLSRRSRGVPPQQNPSE